MNYEIINMGGIIFKFPINDSEEFVSDAVPVDYDNDIDDDMERFNRWFEQNEQQTLLNDENNFGSHQYL